MYRSSDKNACQPRGWQVKSVQCRSLWTQNKFLSWLSVTYYRYIVLFEMQNHSAHYTSSYPQREMITNVNPQPHDKDILSPCVNCTSKILLQCILEPFSIVSHSVHFLSAAQAWKGKEFFKDRGKLFISEPYLTQTFTHSFAKWMQHKHIPQDHHRTAVLDVPAEKHI